jgi:NAD(P)H-dependent FMN reductase
MEPLFIPVFYGSYRRDRLGIRLANYAVGQLREREHRSELVDAKAVGLPMLDRMYKEYPEGEAPPEMEAVAEILRSADGFMLVAGEYNWGMQPGLKNLTDHFLEEWFWRPVAILSYSAGRLAGARSSYAWHPTLAEMGMVVVPSTVAVPQIGNTFDETGHPRGDAGEAVSRGMDKTIATLEWWATAAKERRKIQKPAF